MGPVFPLEQELDDLGDILHVDRGLLGEGEESVLLHDVVSDVGRDELQGAEDALCQPGHSRTRWRHDFSETNVGFRQDLRPVRHTGLKSTPVSLWTLSSRGRGTGKEGERRGRTRTNAPSEFAAIRLIRPRLACFAS